jgi:hypothetical protein
MPPPARTSALILAALAVGVAVAAWLAGAGAEEGAGERGVTPAEGVHVTAPAPATRRAPDRRLELDVPAGTHPIVWVRPGERVEVRTEPGGGEVAEVVRRRTEFGSPTVFGVVRTAGAWAGVKAPFLANDHLGWIRLDSRRLKAGWTDKSIAVDLSARRMVAREGGRPVRAFTVTVGAPGSETPTGRFAVTDTFRGGLNPVYGCCAVALTANQPNLPSGWLGGNRIAVHGNGGGDPLGVAASNGCLRAADEDVSALVDWVDLGAPVLIRQ